MSNLSSNFAAIPFDAVVSSMSEALVYSDLEGIVQSWNPGAVALFGFSMDEAVGQSLDLIIPSRFRQAHWEGYKRAIERRATVPGRASRITRAMHKNGEQIYVDMSFALAINEAGDVLGAFAVARDATARFLEEKQLRAQLAELRKSQS
jgi:PAS domain S-box-containing protein